MNPATTLRLRRLTSAFAVLWVLLAFLAGLGAKLEARQQPTSPFNWVGLGGVFVVAHVTPDAEAAGVRVGDRLIGVDGRARLARTRRCSTVSRTATSSSGATAAATPPHCPRCRRACARARSS